MTTTARSAALAAASIAAITAAANAGLVTGNIDTDPEFNALALPEVAVAEGRIGNNALNGTFELDLGENTGAPAETAQFVWGNGVAEAFSLDYDPNAGTLDFSLGGNDLSFALNDAVNGIYIRTRATQADTSVLIDNLTLDTDAITGSALADGNADGVEYFFITGNQLLNGFSLTGNATLAWDSLPTNSNLAFQIKLTVPATGPAAIFALAGLAAARRRR